MEIGLKDGVYLAIFFATIVTMWNGFHHDVVDNAKEAKTNSDDMAKLLKLFKSVMFSESGELLLTTKKEFGKLQNEMTRQNNNLVAIMVHLKITGRDNVIDMLDDDND
jgi:hypothetical protein